MTLKAATTPLVISMTNGAADAFVQGSVITGLSGRQAYNVIAVYFEFVFGAWGTPVDADNYELAISRRSKSAMPNISDSDVIWKTANRYWQAVDGSGWRTVSGQYNFDREVPIVEETIYAQFDSAGSAVVSTAIVRLEVELDTMSDIDRLNLITRSLS